MTFGSDFWLELGIGIGDWGLGIAIGDLGLGIRSGIGEWDQERKKTVK